MTDICIPDVRELYFLHKHLTPLVGQPNHVSLRILTDELKANDSSVPSTLDGGMYGHPGLILSADIYSQLLSKEFKVPTNPDVFTTLVTYTAAHISAQKKSWKKAHYTKQLINHSLRKW